MEKKKISQEMQLIYGDTIDTSAANQIKEAAKRLSPDGLEYEGTIAVHIYRPKNVLNYDSVTYTFMTHILADALDMMVAKEACEALFGSVKEAYGYSGKNRPELQA
jgi:hypothetical protein